MDHLPSRNLWKSMSPCVVLAWKFGAGKNVSHHTVLLYIHFIPMDPSLNRGCSAGREIPRRSEGRAGRWKFTVGRAAERRAREAARGKKDAIVRIR